jgi:pyruvate dehydrogenase E2 component (dihydrolipoamide acetyltransferase)
LTQVKGSGENGRIVKSDVENFTPAQQSTPAEADRCKAPTAAAPAAKVCSLRVLTEELRIRRCEKS